MTRMTGGSASVERKIGRAISCPNGDNERPYGRCYGQVCWVSYPSICAAARAIKMKHSTLSYRLNEHGRAVCNGRSYELEEVS